MIRACRRETVRLSTRSGMLRERPTSWVFGVRTIRLKPGAVSRTSASGAPLGTPPMTGEERLTTVVFAFASTAGAGGGAGGAGVGGRTGGVGGFAGGGFINVASAALAGSAGLGGGDFNSVVSAALAGSA